LLALYDCENIRNEIFRKDTNKNGISKKGFSKTSFFGGENATEMHEDGVTGMGWIFLWEVEEGSGRILVNPENFVSLQLKSPFREMGKWLQDMWICLSGICWRRIEDVPRSCWDVPVTC